MAGRPKGLPKTGGRKTGTKNKHNLGVREMLAARNFDVIAEMILLYQKTESEEHPGYASVAGKMLSELASYCYPKLKAVEHSGEINNPFMSLTLEELKEIVRQKLK